MTSVLPVKAVASCNDDLLPESTGEDTRIRYIEIGDVREAEGVTGWSDYAFGAAPSRARRVVRTGDVLVSTVRTYLRAVAAVGPAHEGAIASTGFAVLRARTVEPRYLRYAILERRFMDEVEARSTGTSYPAINASDLVKIKIRVPAKQVQRAVADFLDRETATIDAFIAKNEELITLLTERRVAVVSRAVTKGLEPNVELKASGVDWLGEVPSTWKVGNIRRFSSMRTGHTPSRQHPEYWVDCEIPWFTLADVWQLRRGKREMSDTNESISQVGLENSSAELLPAGTVALSRTASVGFTGIMPVPMATSQDYWNWIPGSDLLSEYLWYQFQAMKPDFERVMTGSTHRTIYQADAASLRIAVPPLDEQRAIVAHLDLQTSRIDSALSSARQAMELARERRAALISAAVTGKIDVGVLE